MEITFSFGKNWENYITKSLNKKRLNLAQRSIMDLLNLRSLKDKIFLDIGCGSGIFSLSAFRLGAKKIISFDKDLYSVKCCNYLKNIESNSYNWDVYQGSVLDKNFLSRIPKADIVYAFGVFHHTGNMWKAIENGASKVKKNGYFYFTIYNKKVGLRGSKNQLRLKKLYNRLPYILKKCLEYTIIGNFFLKNFLFLKNPFKIIRDKENSIFNRGMTFRNDVVDWLGGLPYEFAHPQEVLDFCTKKLKLQLIKICIVDEKNSLGNNHYLFRRVNGSKQ